jgi:hypothetical protein
MSSKTSDCGCGRKCGRKCGCKKPPAGVYPPYPRIPVTYPQYYGTYPQYPGMIPLHRYMWQ